MNKFFHFALLYFAAWSLCSCIADEQPNTECDVHKVWVSVDDYTTLFFQPSDVQQEVASSDSVIVFQVLPSADLTRLAPEFEITPGATIEPASGTPRDFSKGPLTYRVTSEDGMWHRDYKVHFNANIPVVYDETLYDFENYEYEPKKNQYYVWYEMKEVVGPDGKLVKEKDYCWATGNPGFAIAKSSAQPMEYPAIPRLDGVNGGTFVELQTRETGPFGKLSGMLMAAGSMFIGTFDAKSALSNAMQATCFGLPFTRKPVRLTGYYQFWRGANFQNKKGEIIPGKLDFPDIYGVLYRNEDANGKAFVLHGDDVLTSENIVALARIANPDVTNGWTRFDLEFEYKKELDETILASRGYSLSIVFSSSVEGASFCGAVGSKLWVDEVTLVCQ